MMAGSRRAQPMPKAPSPAQMHRAWLALVDSDGPFLAVPPLLGVYPQGMPPIPSDAKAALTSAKPPFDRAWDTWDASSSAPGAAAPDPADPVLHDYRAARDAWVDVVLRDVLGWGDLLTTTGPALETASATSERGDIRVRPNAALVHGDHVGALVSVVDPVDDLRDLLDDGWAASPIDRMEAMLRAGGCSIGLVTDGRWWALVSTPQSGLPASGVVDAFTWVEEAATRDAFVALCGPRRLVGGRESERLPQLFAESVLAAEQITESLGTQVRQAVELIVQALSDASRSARDRGEPDPLPRDGHVVYEAVVTVMMRVVFLLFAQERGLLPQGRVFTDGYGLAGQLDALDARSRSEGEESLDGTFHTWHRLLATSQALHSGATFEDLRLPAYGGSLFDPARFPFLTATTARGTLAVTVSDRVMLQVLRAVQVAHVRGQEARRISFRDIDVEQIGYIYEGLLGYTCRRADDVIVGLIGTAGAEPEIPLDALDDLAEEYPNDRPLADAIRAWAKTHQPAAKAPSATALAKALAAGDTLEDAERALLPVTRDEELRTRLQAYLGVIRRDLRGRPAVVEPGGLVVVETPSRRNAGAHYTPRALAEEVVHHALEPLVYRPGPHQTDDQASWRLVSSTDILGLRVADIACGSGAFLVAAARYLARKLVEAWHAEGSVTMPPHELEVDALRKVVAQCLYGADINGMAVEMCKLSLWLVSLDRDLPFSFVDDKVMHGNSLLGLTDVRQLRELHIAPQETAADALFYVSGGQAVQALDISPVMRRVIERRRALASVVDDRDPARTATTKRRLLGEIETDSARLAAVADAIIAAGLPFGGAPGKKLDQAYDNLRAAVGAAFPESGEGDPTHLDALLTGLEPSVETDYVRWQPLHWALAVPDVMERGGFDAIVGNPPFLGGQKLTGAMGTDVRDWFVNVLAGGKRGSADLVGYFLLRAHSLLTPRGTLGLIATNTVAQGDTREVGLDRLAEQGFTITRAIQSRSWPAASANLEYAAVWGTRGAVADDVTRISDEAPTRRISTLLEPAGRVEGHPVRLRENRGIAFQGCIVLGKGFILKPEEAAAWTEADSRNAGVLFPYLNGEDLNSRPDASASRWVIDFYGYCEQCASRLQMPFERVQETVKPERSRNNRAARRENWWLFAENSRGLRRAVAGLDEVLVIALVSKTVMPVRVPTGQVFSHALGVLVLDGFDGQATLSSSLHQMWAIKHGSGMRGDPRYTPSDVFETFPRPSETSALNTLGLSLHEMRAEIMRRRELGLTKLYNLVNDPDITGDPDIDLLRQSHVDVDRAVMDAYGWGDVPLDHGFHTYRQMRRWTVSPAARLEILDRLLEENHRRAEKERAAGAPADLGDPDGADDVEKDQDR